MKVSCPVCRKMTQWKGNPWRPFCSERCKTIDLASWASEEYRIPAERLGEEELEEERRGKTDEPGDVPSSEGGDTA